MPTSTVRSSAQGNILQLRTAVAAFPALLAPLRSAAHLLSGLPLFQLPGSQLLLSFASATAGLSIACGVVWCGVVWCGVVWCGVVWCGVVWCGVVWCGVVWCGVQRMKPVSHCVHAGCYAAAFQELDAAARHFAAAADCAPDTSARRLAVVQVAWQTLCQSPDSVVIPKLTLPLHACRMSCVRLLCMHRLQASAVEVATGVGSAISHAIERLSAVGLYPTPPKDLPVQDL